MTNAYAVLPPQESLKSMILQQDPSLSGDAFLAEYNAKGSAQNIPMPSPVNEDLLASVDDANSLANSFTKKLKVPVEVAEDAFGGIAIDWNWDNSGEETRRGYTLKFSYDCHDGSGLVAYSPIVSFLIEQRTPDTYLRFSPSNGEVCYWPHTHSGDTFTIAWWDANGGVHPIA